MKLKNIVKTISALLLALMTVMGISMTAFAADSSVTFKDGKLTVFEPGTVHTDTNLFDNFAGVMPGDTRTEEITIQNKSKDYDYIKVYIRADLHDESGNPVSEKVLNELTNDECRGELSEVEHMHDFLAQLSMTVKNGDNEIYKASPNELDAFAENAYLDTLRKDESVKINVELAVPIEMGNEYANRIGEVDWVFVVEGYDDPKPTRSDRDSDDSDDPDPSPRPPRRPSNNSKGSPTPVNAPSAVSPAENTITPPNPEFPEESSVADAQNTRKLSAGNPATGDTTHRVLWTMLSVGSGILLLGLILLKRRLDKTEDK